MKSVEPIRDKDDIERMKDFMESWNQRNFLLFVFGLNSGLRISDLLKLKVRDVLDSHVVIKEQKTGKQRKFIINNYLRRQIDKYIKAKVLKPYDYLFESNKRDSNGKKRPIGREQAWKILNKCAKACGLKRIGTHSLRKTFGYHMYKKDHNVALLMEIFNHASPDITLRYICITQDETDEAMFGFSL
ncbi:site-specific integrase [Streptococcus suis]|uniref:Recombinase-phage associated n=1 Tax=Streptococcus suis TaxID=1307 RepID=A0A116QWX0_STRSU|nr:site-specific integrase [Streptococcus suis]NQG42602.1 site-specific integrase [Streptococcus suis]NQG46177.1 site-specific integrase [Streptococcus suis]NQG72673.1 site-specific integrase [Streptococcus suis]NQO90132.1 site-specific integrase [Streptococcus suis]NQQ50816.1 site-specific integrase [Streptococcus suis]